MGHGINFNLLMESTRIATDRRKPLE